MNDDHGQVPERPAESGDAPALGPADARYLRTIERELVTAKTRWLGFKWVVAPSIFAMLCWFSLKLFENRQVVGADELISLAALLLSLWGTWLAAGNFGGDVARLENEIRTHADHAT